MDKTMDDDSNTYPMMIKKITHPVDKGLKAWTLLVGINQ